MSTRWHFDNNAERAQNYRKLDTNIDHYKSKYDHPYKPKNDYQQKEYQVGVSMTYIDGSYFRTNNFTVDYITDALESGKRWIELQNGGRINLGYVIHYEPYKFFDHDDNRQLKAKRSYY